MVSREKVQSYLVDLGLSFDEVDSNTWLVTDEDKGLKNIVILVSEPLVILRVKVMELPQGDRVRLYERLLRLNAEDLLHGAYALEGDHVILIDTLQLESMDLEDLRASIEAMGLALAQHYKILSEYRRKG
jgi:hypothetical protein